MSSELARLPDSWFSSVVEEVEQRVGPGAARPNPTSQTSPSWAAAAWTLSPSAVRYSSVHSFPVPLMDWNTVIHMGMVPHTFSGQSVTPRPTCRFYLIMITIIPSSWHSELFMSHRGGRPSGQGEEAEREPTHWTAWVLNSLVSPWDPEPSMPWTPPAVLISSCHSCNVTAAMSLLRWHLCDVTAVTSPLRRHRCDVTAVTSPPNHSPHDSLNPDSSLSAPVQSSPTPTPSSTAGSTTQRSSTRWGRRSWRARRTTSSAPCPTASTGRPVAGSPALSSTPRRVNEFPPYLHLWSPLWYLPYIAVNQLGLFYKAT